MYIFLNVFFLQNYKYDCKEIQPVHSEGDQPWDFFGRNNVKAETPILWPPHAKCWLIGKDFDARRDWGQEKGTTEDEMAGWHHWLDGCESEWTLGVGDGQGGLACYDSWGCEESDPTERLNWTELDWTDLLHNGLAGSPCSPKDSQEWSPTPQFKSINSSALSLLHSPNLTSIHDHTGKTIALTRQYLVGKVMYLLLNMLSRLIIAFLPRSKRHLISWL